MILLSKNIRSGLLWYGVKLPLTVALVPLGLLFDVLLAAPFRLAMFIDRPTTTDRDHHH
jgi:hypothetical protein